MTNPFIEKANKRKERQRAISTRNLRELEALLARIEKGTDTHKRITARVAEARQIARDDA